MTNDIKTGRAGSCSALDQLTQAFSTHADRPIATWVLQYWQPVLQRKATAQLSEFPIKAALNQPFFIHLNILPEWPHAWQHNPLLMPSQISSWGGLFSSDSLFHLYAVFLIILLSPEGAFLDQDDPAWSVPSEVSIQAQTDEILLLLCSRFLAHGWLKRLQTFHRCIFFFFVLVLPSYKVYLCLFNIWLNCSVCYEFAKLLMPFSPKIKSTTSWISFLISAFPSTDTPLSALKQTSPAGSSFVCVQLLTWVKW